MIDDKTRSKLLQEITKTGNIYVSCLKVGVDTATYYRWLKKDSAFRKQAQKANHIGRGNMCDLAEHSLLLKVKEKDIKAIQYFLSHNSPRYKPKAKQVQILHPSPKESERETSLKNKEIERSYYEGYSEAIKKFTESIEVTADEDGSENQ